jgi:hypothetical protein
MIRVLVVALSIVIPSVTHAEMLPRTSSSSSTGCMTVIVSVRPLNSLTISVVAIASKRSNFTFNRVQGCQNSAVCTHAWMRSAMKLGENAMTLMAVSDTCSVGITSYVDVR